VRASFARAVVRRGLTWHARWWHSVNADDTLLRTPFAGSLHQAPQCYVSVGRCSGGGGYRGNRRLASPRAGGIGGPIARRSQRAMHKRKYMLLSAESLTHLYPHISTHCTHSRPLSLTDTHSCLLACVRGWVGLERQRKGCMECEHSLQCAGRRPLSVVVGTRQGLHRG
jgi:hypothetical protein